MNKRYFFVSTLGISNDGGQIFHNCDITMAEYPSIKIIENHVKSQKPKIQQVLILGITEMSETDYKTFRGE